MESRPGESRSRLIRVKPAGPADGADPAVGISLTAESSVPLDQVFTVEDDRRTVKLIVSPSGARADSVAVSRGRVIGAAIGATTGLIGGLVAGPASVRGANRVLTGFPAGIVFGIVFGTVGYALGRAVDASRVRVGNAGDKVRFVMEFKDGDVVSPSPSYLTDTLTHG